MEGCIYGHRILKRDGKVPSQYVHSEGGGERMSEWMYDCIVIGWVYRSFDVWMNGLKIDVLEQWELEMNT